MSGSHRWLTLMLMCAGMFLVLLDVTIVNVALPSLSANLNGGTTGGQWVVDGYAIPLASLLLIAGVCGDRYGHKKIALTGFVTFGVASVVGALAPHIGVLIGARVLQGIGAAMLLPATLAIIALTFPERRERAHALGIWAGVSSVALPAGPVLGGLLVTTLGWPAVFWLNVPVLAVVIVATIVVVRSQKPPQRKEAFDIAGALMFTFALTAAVLAVIEAGAQGITWVTFICLLVVTGCGAVFVIVERKTLHPLVPLAVLRNRAFMGANTVAGLMNFVVLGLLFVLTLYLQEIEHLSPLDAGLTLLPLFLPLAIFSPLTGRIVGKWGPRAPMVSGLAVGLLGALLLATTIGTGVSWILITALLAIGLGLALLTAAVVTAALASLPSAQSGLASGANNTARQAFGALGVAVFGAVAGSTQQPTIFINSIHTLALIGAGLWGAAILITTITMRPKNTTKPE